MTSIKPIEILLVDDDEADIELTKRSLLNNKIHIRLNVCYDGVEALDYLQKKAPYENAATPDIILLDLNMPRKDGRETLNEIKNNAQFKKIPVVILTTSDAEEDIIQTYDLGCNCYITKPVDLIEFSKVLKTLEQFWFTIVKLP